MTYRIEYSRRAQREIDELQPQLRQRVLKEIDDLMHDPRPPGCKKLVQHDEWRIKVSDWRIIYEINDRVVLVKVVRVSHRSSAYRDR
jgi:mRNA interferase RelE/StbE